MSRLSAYGTHVMLGNGWEGEIYRRHSVSPDEHCPTVLHVASFALAPSRGDFGGGALASMSARDIFVSLFEYASEDAGGALFAREGPPWPFGGDDFSPSALRVAIGNQSGLQRFFRIGGRPFCVYVVLGSHTLRHLLAGAVNDVLAGVEFDR